jgi:small-conductance mechanosensitive channel
MEAEFWNLVLAVWQHPVFGASGDAPITVGQIVLVLLLLAVGLLGGRIAQRQVGRRLLRSHLQPDAAHAIERILFYGIVALVAVTAMGLLNIPLTAFAFVSGAVAIGVGFGAQNIINNFISGWILMTERPVRMGDFIEIDGAHGTVETIGNRSTRIRRVDGVHLLVPNSTLLEQTVVNWTLVDNNVRTSVSVGVAYGSDVKLVAELIAKAAAEHPDILKEPPPVVVFDDFGDSALQFEVLFWSDAGAERGLRAIRSDLRFTLNARFAEHNISIPFPQRDVHLYGRDISPSEPGS